MFDDLIALFSGWYTQYVTDIRDLLQYSSDNLTAFELSDGTVYSDTVSNVINPTIWSAYVPWEQIIAAVVLVTFVICIFKFMRSILCRIL